MLEGLRSIEGGTGVKRCVISAEATVDLGGIWDYIAARASADVANGFVWRFHEAFASITLSPGAGVNMPDFAARRCAKVSDGELSDLLSRSARQNSDRTGAYASVWDLTRVPGLMISCATVSRPATERRSGIPEAQATLIAGHETRTMLWCERGGSNSHSLAGARS